MPNGMDEFFGRSHVRPPLIAFECNIVNGASSQGDQVDAKERNGNKMLHRDCKWNRQWGPSGAVYPSSGDRALVVISDEGLPWIIEWISNE